MTLLVVKMVKILMKLHVLIKMVKIVMKAFLMRLSDVHAKCLRLVKVR